MKDKTKKITYTAILLALTLVFQSLRNIIPQGMDQYIIGSLVNACLIISAIIVGMGGGIAISVIAPLVALLQGEIAFPILVPFVAIGNSVIVIVVALLYDKNKYLALSLGTILKFLVLYIMIVYMAIPIITPKLPPEKAKKVTSLLSLKFSWPQLVTAAIGSIIAISIVPAITKANREQ
ncbi:MAG: ECF transporter S component [Xylanivirga thermophila]|jgi:uncharacterized membrane protein|uniref:ECF transporter S component n=1 Tax=Xylanivirga thermophila TaxID=2496273 RepID=UPI00101CF1DA|nr:ECF transporter S component [Xylanivirga thermophila]